MDIQKAKFWASLRNDRSSKRRSEEEEKIRENQKAKKKTLESHVQEENQSS